MSGRILVVVEVESQVRHHALSHERVFDEIAEQRGRLILREFDAQPDLNFTGELGLFALLDFLDSVPKRLAVVDQTRGGYRGQGEARRPDREM